MKCSKCVKTVLIIVGALAAVAGIAAAIWASREKLMALKERCCGKKNYIDVIEFPQREPPAEPEAAQPAEPEAPTE